MWKIMIVVCILPANRNLKLKSYKFYILYKLYITLYVIELQKLPRYEVLNLERPQTYTIVFGVQRATEMIRDNLGFFYYKNKKTENKM